MVSYDCRCVIVYIGIDSIVFVSSGFGLYVRFLCFGFWCVVLVVVIDFSII